ncbi:MAG: hypothetical protein IPH07_06430 [Deltaproteobacteria bacterium]|nr:hypothetical protein [Deltaproteobacteria bacterium]MBK8718013.1 hypothetical protein [Deltaproteobacteria bacterium]
MGTSVQHHLARHLVFVLAAGCGGDETISPAADDGETAADVTSTSLDDDATTQGEPATTTRIVGGVHKGPFVIGSSIELAALDDDGNPTGLVFHSQTASDRGEFELTVELGVPGVVALVGEGFHFDEVAGALSGAPMTLRALAELTTGGTQEVYLNLVTHLAHLRVGTLVQGGAPLATATAQAEAELRAALGIGPTGFDPGVTGTAMNLLGGDDDANAYAFAVGAVLLQAARDEVGPDGPVDAAVQELANAIAAELAVDGTLSIARQTALAQAEAHLDADAAIAALQSRFDAIGATATAPDLHRVLDPDGDDLADRDDNCPHVANADQPDGDADGVGDACECGNGVVDFGETCDDGNAVSLDGCQNDCTASCERVAIAGAAVGDRLDGFASLDDGVLFWHRRNVEGQSQATLWRAAEGVAAPVTTEVYFDASAPIPLGDAVVFGGRTTGPIALWRSDGTEAGTTWVEELYDSVFEGAVLDDALVYRGGTNVVGLELDVSDGTPAGTSLLADLAPGAAHGWPRSLARIDDAVWFTTGPCSALGQQLWTTDGTPGGTTMIAEVGGAGSCAPVVRPPVASLGLTFFSVARAGGGVDLWRSDGTALGTTLVRASSQAIAPGEVDGAAIFGAADGLYRTDGSVAGTTRIRTFEQTTALVGLGGLGLVDARDAGLHGLWVTDGSEAGTTLLVLLGSGAIGPTAVVGGHLFAFLPDYFTGRRRLWVSDGTVAGTHVVQAFSEAGDNGVQALTATGGALYFGADDGISLDPWRCATQ